jgi:hypothetical protein
MSTPRAPGGYAYREIVRSGEIALDEANEALRRLIDERPGPQTQAMLIATAAVRLNKARKAFAELDEIGLKCKAK